MYSDSPTTVVYRDCPTTVVYRDSPTTVHSVQGQSQDITVLGQSHDIRNVHNFELISDLLSALHQQSGMQTAEINSPIFFKKFNNLIIPFYLKVTF